MKSIYGEQKKSKNRLNRKNRKKITEKTKPWKKQIRIFKKIFGSVRFHKPETKKSNQTKINKKKTEPEKSSQTETKPITNYKINPKKYYSFLFLI
jgi:hypothetical protein